MSLAPGTSLGPYEIVSLLGSGGMGEVYRARDRRLERDVALKTLSPRAGLGEESINRFEREARAASALNHPHILHVYDVGAESDTRYMVMELVEGETLRRKMKSGAPITDLLDWLRQAGEAVARAHAAGIIHRDLKPENIMVTDDGWAKVLDFGLAKLVNRDASEQAQTVVRALDSTPGLILGTVGYMSPEQAQGRPVDHRSDIFSFGCILHEALGGHSPFTGGSELDTLHRLVYSEPSALPPSVPPALRHIAERCLAKERDARYGSMKEVLEELEAAQRSTSGGAISSQIPASEQRAIAVLPFSDLSPAKDSDYLGDGVAEEIITDLSKIEALRVVSRGSAAAFKGTQQPMPDVARALNVRYIVTGSVRRAGERLRIAAQLLEAASDSTLWAEKFDGTMEDIFDIQEKVARSIAGQLRVKLTSRESEQIRERPIENVAAYECYLRARNHIYQFTSSSLDAALREIDGCIAMAGELPVLLSLKALALWQYYNSGANTDPANLDRAEEIARKILAVDPNSARARTILGLVAVHRNQLQRAVRSLNEALVQNPNDLDALAWLPTLYLLAGYPEKARQVLPRLVALDPMSFMAQLLPPLTDAAEGLSDRALEQFLQRRSNDPDWPVRMASVFLVQLLHFTGRQAELAALADEELKLHPADPFAKIGGMLRFAVSGDRARVEELFTDDVRAVASNDLQYCSWIAEVFGALGDGALSAEWLRKGLQRGFTSYRYIAEHDRFFDPVRNDPRFIAVLEDMRAAWLAFEA